MSRTVLSVLILSMLCVASIPLFPAASAAVTPANVCGVVTNAAGWPVAGATVILGVSRESAVASVLAPQLAATATTNAAGAFQVAYVENWGHLEYTLAVIASPEGPVRYAPFQASLAPEDAPEGACPAGTSGLRHDVELTAPLQALLEVTTLDALTGDAIAGATVALGPIAATSDQNGVARLACPTPAGGAAYAFSADGYVPAALQLACTTENALVEADAALWRKPLHVVASITRDDAVEGLVEQPFAGAGVHVANFPAELDELDPTKADCVAAAAGIQGVVDAPAVAPVDPASPYVCTATSNEAGLAVLRLPWSAAGQYALIAETPGYGATTTLTITRADAALPPQPSPQALPVRVTPNGQGSSIAGPATRYVWMSLEAAQLVFSEKVVDLAGAAVEGATVRFEGPSVVEATTLATGMFSAVIPTGFYDVTITHAAYATRGCGLAVDSTPTGVELREGSLEPSYCWTLVKKDRVAYLGRTVDSTTRLGMQDVEVCVDEECERTGSDGSFSLEAAASSESPLVSTPTPPWSGVGRTRGEAVAGDIVDVGELSHVRNPSCVSLVPGYNNGAIADADVTITQAGAIVAQGTSAGGGFSVMLPWTDGPGSTFDTPNYAASIRRDRSSPWLTSDPMAISLIPGTSCAPTAAPLRLEATVSVAMNATIFGTFPHQPVPVLAHIVATPTSPTASCAPVNCLATVPVGGHATLTLGTEHTYFVCASAHGYNATCVERWTPQPTLDLRMKTRFPGIEVKAVDAHTGQVIPAVASALSIDNTPACADISEVCVATGAPALLRLHGGNYRLCVAPTESALYQPRCAATKTIVQDSAAITTVTISVPRHYKEFTFKALDAHTGSPLEDLKLEVATMSPSFVCDVTTNTPNTPDFVCASGETSASGTAGTASNPAVRVPLLRPGEGCWVVHGKAYDIAPAATTQNVLRYDQADVATAWRCDNMATLTNGSELSFAMTRVADAPITGIVKSALDGSPAEGVEIRATLRRAPTPAVPAFVCAPESDAVNETPFPDCYGVASDEDGAFSLTLPVAGSLPYVWSISVSAPGFFTETYENVPGGADLGEIVLWPETFELAITLDYATAAGSTGGCLQEDPRVVTAIVKDLEVVGGPYRATFDTAVSCTTVIDIPTWNHVSVHVYGAPPVTEKTTDAFLIQMDEDGFFVADVKLAGPAESSITVTARDPEAQPTADVQTREMRGSLKDADRILAGLPVDQLGVAGALVIAKRVDGACYGATDTVANLSLPTGEFALTLPCPGHYTLDVVPLGAVAAPGAPASMPLYTPPATRTVDATEQPAPVTIAMARTRVATIWAIVLQPADALTSPPATSVRFTGVDTGVTQTAAVENFIARSAALPWGVFRVSPVAPAATLASGVVPANAPADVVAAGGSVVAVGVPQPDGPQPEAATFAVVILSPPPATEP